MPPTPSTARPLGPVRLVPMTEPYARALLAWRYPPPYDVYNADAETADEVVRTVLLNPDYHYYAVLDPAGDMVAFRCFGADAQVPGGDYSATALDMGGGLRPDLTGRRFGPQIHLAAIAWARQHFDPPAFRTTVAAWNTRALRAVASIGYVRASTFANPGGQPFVILLRPA